MHAKNYFARVLFSLFVYSRPLPSGRIGERARFLSNFSLRGGGGGTEEMAVLMLVLLRGIFFFWRIEGKITKIGSSKKFMMCGS